MNGRRPQSRPSSRPSVSINKRERGRLSRRQKLRTDLIVILLFGILVVYLIFHFASQNSRVHIEQIQVVMGNLQEPRQFVGLISRDETIYAFEDVAYELRFLVENNQRILQGEPVAAMGDARQISEIQQSLAQIEQEAISLQNETPGTFANEVEIYATNRAIADLISSNSFDLAAGNISSLNNLSNSLQNNINHRNSLYFEGFAASHLALERNEIINSLNLVSRNIYASRPGIINFSNNFDGNSAFRIIHSNDWFIEVTLPSAYASHLFVGSFLTLFVQEYGEVIEVPVNTYSIENRGAEVFVIFQTNRHTLRFIGENTISFAFEASLPEGFIVPNSAIAYLNRFIVPREFVFVRENVYVVERIFGNSSEYIHVLGNYSNESEDFYILSDFNNIRFGDDLRSPAGDTIRINDSSSVAGIFISNFGYASFRPISFYGSHQTLADYTLLDPNFNHNIRVFDRFVRDASIISPGEIIN